MTLLPALGAPDMKGQVKLPYCSGPACGCSTCRQLLTPPTLQHGGSTC